MELDSYNWWDYKEFINERVSIVELIKRYNIEVEDKNTGNFSHRAYCPFHSGKDGNRERTPSLFISNKTNSFFCFSCTASGDSIKFVSLIDGTPPNIAVKKILKEFNLDGQVEDLSLSYNVQYTYDPTKTIEPYLIDMSNIVRNYIKLIINSDNFDKEFKWIEKITKKLDKFLDKIDYEDWEDAIKIRDNLYKKIKNRNYNR